MFKLTIDEVNSIAEAVESYDCAGVKSAYEKVGNIPAETELIVMTVEELRAIQAQIYELEEAGEQRNWQPGILGCMSTINELCK